MTIKDTYSHYTGHEYLLVHRPAVWKEVEQVIAGVEPGGWCSLTERDRSAHIRNAFRHRLQKDGWNAVGIPGWFDEGKSALGNTLDAPVARRVDALRHAGVLPLRKSDQRQYSKDRVAVTSRFASPSFVAYDLYVKHMAFFVNDLIDVGIEILPVKELQAQMSSGVAYYEGELYNLIRQGRGSPAVPLVMVGIAP